MADRIRALCPSSWTLPCPTGSWCGSTSAPRSVDITDAVVAIPFRWPGLAQAWAGDELCGARAKPGGLCPQQHAEVSLLLYFTEKAEGKDKTGPAQNVKEKHQSVFGS